MTRHSRLDSTSESRCFHAACLSVKRALTTIRRSRSHELTQYVSGPHKMHRLIHVLAVSSSRSVEYSARCPDLPSTGHPSTLFFAGECSILKPSKSIAKVAASLETTEASMTSVRRVAPYRRTSSLYGATILCWRKTCLKWCVVTSVHGGAGEMLICTAGLYNLDTG